MFHLGSTIRLACVGLAIALLAGLSSSVQADIDTPVTGGGTGIYCPNTGYFFGEGDGTPLGKSYYHGVIALEPTGPLTYNFANAGRGTQNESFHETIAVDGSTLSFRFSGTVQLIPIDLKGNFTAQWRGVWTIVKGTGRMRNAKGDLNVVAINDPFNVFVPSKWTFNWTWSGTIKMKKNAAKHYVHLQTGGFGVFDPANIGLGDPAWFPLVIGDGSGLGVYNGTPTGNEFKLDGQLVGDGFDRHIGAAQSLTTGIPAYGNVYYPGETAPNPDGSGRTLHIMQTRVGEIWYQNNYYFELVPTAGVAGVIYARCDFRITGGTGMFSRARGTVYCQVESHLVDVFVDPQGEVNAPFRYDFRGYVALNGND